jgi:hypothetical protein
MPPVILSSVVDLTKIKMKWKEQYVSEGINQKVTPSSPRGIYSGLKIVQNVSSPRQVEVSSGIDVLHVAVSQNSSGYSTTYYDAGGSAVILNLSSASLSNQETVITLFINYTIGASTTANWIAYTIADWDALTSAQRREHIVLGTVNVPGVAANITSAMILSNQRTVAWENASPGIIAWTPVVKNGDFENSIDNGVFEYASSYWLFNQHVNGQWKVQSADPSSGTRALAFNQLIAAAPSSQAVQAVGIKCTPGQLIRYRFKIKNLKVPTSGSLSFLLKFVDSALNGPLSAGVNIPMTSIDSVYRTIDGIIAAPVTSSQLYSFSFENSLNQSSTGIAFRVDEVEIWVESANRKVPFSDEQSRQHVHTQSIVIESKSDPLNNYLGPAALINMPVDDQMWIGRRDNDVATGTPIDLVLRSARIAQLGQDLLNTETRALLARVSAPIATGANIDFTLWESVAGVGLKTLRLYAGDMDSSTVTQPGFLFTVNARWNGTDFVKDVNTVATALYLSGDASNGGFFRVMTQSTLNVFTKAQWESSASLNIAATELQMFLQHSNGTSESGGVFANKLVFNSNAVSDVIKPFVSANLGVKRRANVMQLGTGAVVGMGCFDPHGRYQQAGRLMESDFENSSLAPFSLNNLTGVGSASVNQFGIATINSGATVSDFSIIQNSLALFTASAGTVDLGFRCRARAANISGADARIGLWDATTFNPDNDNALNGFKIVNGVVNVVWTDTVLHVVATGVTVSTTDRRWYSYYFNPTSGVIQWHISNDNASIQDGYTGGTYGEQTATGIGNGNALQLFAGVKAILSGAKTLKVDYIGAWSNNRQSL